jgi:hypothetical protein
MKVSRKVLTKEDSEQLAKVQQISGATCNFVVLLVAIPSQFSTLVFVLLQNEILVGKMVMGSFQILFYMLLLINLWIELYKPKIQVDIPYSLT